jgi:tetratricopeptide (TPR) repeat protein
VKPGRNDPCPCGSGKKFKKCCESKRLEASAANHQSKHRPHTEVPQSATLTDSDKARAATMVKSQRFPELEEFARLLVARTMHSGIAWKMLGFALAQQGKDCLEASRNAATLLPNDPEVHRNLGNALQALGQSAEALNSFRRAIDLAPDCARAYNEMGSALVDIGHLDEAAASYRRAINLKADFAMAHSNLGSVLRSLGKHEEAIVSYRKAVALQPNSAEVHASMGIASLELGQPREALAHFQTALQIRPDSVVALGNIGTALRELGQIDAAETSYRRALALNPDEANLHVNLAMILFLQERNSEAEDSCRRALEIDPQLVLAIVVLAKLQGAKGLFEEAERLLWQATSLQPKSPDAWAAIPGLRKMRLEDVHWLTEAQQILDQRLRPDEEMRLRYAVGKYFDDTNDFASAFGSFRRANQLAKRLNPRYDRAKLVEFVDEIMGTFDQSLLARARPDANPSRRPVFVVGMPRSGTTLAEQILASHPDVFGAGELRYWGSALTRFPALVAARTEKEAIASLAENYLHLLEQMSAGAARVVDKLPSNFLAIGLIRAALPNARIIHMRRDPVDTCLSIYFQDIGLTVPYANDLEDLAHYYAEYLRIMKHWRSAPHADGILDVPYEKLVEDQETWSRTMLEFIGLPWEPRCMDFHLTNRVVNTASNWQVRQKISKSSIGRSRNYQAYVEPLRGLRKLDY